MKAASGHACDCERCGAELLPADPAPLCATCWVSDSSVSVPALVITSDTAGIGSAPARVAETGGPDDSLFRVGLESADPEGAPQRSRRRRNRRRLMVAFACVTAVALTLAIVPAAVSHTTPPPTHLGAQKTGTGTDECVANLYVLMADKVAHRDSPADIVCPGCGRPYIYTQYDGITTISCPDAAAHGAMRIYIRTDTRVPVVN
jgi:hypothetical protein